MFTEQNYIHACLASGGLGPATLKKCRLRLASWHEVFDALKAHYFDDLLTDKQKERIRIFYKNFNLENSVAEMTKLGIQTMDQNEDGYPQLLKEINSPPLLIYYKGTISQTDSLSIALVGTRKCTRYGEIVTKKLATELSASGITIISGLAFGIDAIAHRAAVETRGKTIAVIGSGLDPKNLYPKEHHQLANDIIDTGGCVMSEYPPGMPGLPQNFVARNRIIAGMSSGTVVIECPGHSGSLITAQFALEFNRSIYAVPGSILEPSSEGPNNLLKLGAKPVTSGSDISSDLNIVSATLPTVPQAEIILTDIEKKILQHISRDPVTSDEIVQQSRLEPSIVQATLVYLELKGAIRNLGAQQYMLK
jgi:DNA processing protein